MEAIIPSFCPAELHNAIMACFFFSNVLDVFQFFFLSLLLPFFLPSHGRERDRCDPQSFLLEVIIPSYEGKVSVIKSIPCDVSGGGGELCVLQVK